jgi:hypothetical protein
MPGRGLGSLTAGRIIAKGSTYDLLPSTLAPDLAHPGLVIKVLVWRAAGDVE